MVRRVSQDYLKHLSDGYFEALNDAKEYHATTDKFSGKFLRPHARHIKAIIDKYAIASITDYGCGKGLQYTWVVPNAKIEQWGDDADGPPHGKTLEEYWGINVFKFDPAVPRFAAEPTESSDLVIVSHVLGAIPEVDLKTIIRRIFDLADKYVYIVEAIGIPKKQWLKDESLTRIYDTMDWIELIAPVKPTHIKCELAVRYRSNYGSHLGRFML